MNPTLYRQIRKQIGSQVYVAELLDVTPETLCRRESGKLAIGKEAELAIERLIGANKLPRLYYEIGQKTP